MSTTIPGERLFIDIRSPKVTSIGGSKHCLSMLDDAMDMSFSLFLSHKDMLHSKLCLGEMHNHTTIKQSDLER